MSDSLGMNWIDLETTGLDARLDAPLEVGLAITDEVGNVKATFHTLIWEKNIDYKRSMERAMKNEFVRSMHEKSGLFDDIKNLDLVKLTRFEADMAMIGFIEANGGEGLNLAGNSIGSLDRPFLLEHFPHFNERVGYRNIDMSSVKELCKRLNPGLFERLKPIIGTKENADHRVLGDIRASIAEYRAYIENFFIVDESLEF